MIAPAVVLSTFGAIWTCAGLFLLHAAWPWCIAPATLSAGLLLWAAQTWRGAMPSPAEERRRARRSVAVWSAAEVVGMFVAVNGLARSGRPDLIPAALCMIVGLHFIPLAKGLAQRTYYATGAGMTAWALGGLLAPALLPAATVSVGAAAVLYLTLLRMIGRREHTQQRGS